MIYRPFGKTGKEVSVLGFGAMRLPLESDSNGDPTKINEAEAIRILRHGIDQGINYIDTAYPYHGKRSEELVGRALGEGYREKVLLATKLPTWLVKEKEDCTKFLTEQLEKLKTDYVDVYLLHAMNAERWETMKRVDFKSFFQEEKKNRRVRMAGFSFHDTPELFREILDSYDWDMCQLQYNYMEAPAWGEAVRYAASKGVAVVAIEPLLGGKLATKVPEAAERILEDRMPGRTPVAWAFQWLFNQPEVSVALSGMSNYSQVCENLKIAAHHGYSGFLLKGELEAYEKAKKAIEDLTKVKCTACEYCMPCPSGVNIPKVFNVYNQCGVFYSEKEAQHEYKYHLQQPGSGADRCTECGACEPQCPQNIPIIQALKDAREMLEVTD